jgi:hypothetical protein
MYKELIMIGATMLMLVLTTSTNNLSAQNATTNASSDVGNMTVANRTGQNASAELNKTGEALGEFGNKTGEAAQKIGAGAAGVFSNLTGEIKEGTGDNSSNSSK